MSETSSKTAKETGPIPPVDDEHPDNDLSDEDEVVDSDDRDHTDAERDAGTFASVVT